MTDIGDVLRRRLTRRRGAPSDPTFTRDPWTAAAAEWLHEMSARNDDGSVLPHADLFPQPTSHR
jgi:hypothetical protein